MLEPSSSEEEEYDTNQASADKHGKFASHLNNTQLFNYHFQQQQLKQQQQAVGSNAPANLPTASVPSGAQYNVQPSNSSVLPGTPSPPIQPGNKQPITSTQFASPLSNTSKQIASGSPRTVNATVASQSAAFQSGQLINQDEQFMRKSSIGQAASYSNVQPALLNQAAGQALRSTSIQTVGVQAVPPNQVPIQIPPSQSPIESLSRTGSLRATPNRRKSLINEAIQHQTLTATSSDGAAHVLLPQSQLATAGGLNSSQQLVPQQPAIASKPTTSPPIKPNGISPVDAGGAVLVTGGSTALHPPASQLNTNPTGHQAAGQQMTAQQMNTGAAVALAIAQSGGINCMGNYPMLATPGQQAAGAEQNDYNNNPFNSITLAMIKQNSTNIAGSLGNQGSLTNQTVALLPNQPDQPPLDDEQIAMDREEQQHKIALQLYVFTVRSVSHPFNAKQATDMPRRPYKVNEPQLELIRTRFRSLVKGELTIASVLASSKSKSSLYSGSNAITASTSAAATTAAASGSAAQLANTSSTSYVESPPCEKLLLEILSVYNEQFLSSNRLEMLVRSCGACLNDFRYLFRKLAEKKVKRSTEIDTFNKEQVLNSFVMKFDVLLPSEDQTYTQHYGNYNYYFVSKKFTTATGKTSQYQMQQQNLQQSNADVVLTKDQIYDMYSRILSIKKFEHQLLFNALQVKLILKPILHLRFERDFLFLSRTFSDRIHLLGSCPILLPINFGFLFWNFNLCSSFPLSVRLEFHWPLPFYLF